jgi:hypothetical protein
MRHRSIVRSVAPLALAVLIMLPRLASPQFGLLDDGLTLQTGREVNGRWWSVLDLIPETGRFFPAYWLAYSAVVGVVGVRPLGFFGLNVLLFAALLAMLVRVVRLGGGTRSQAAVAAVLFAASGPAVETFYTLSKAESLQMAWIGLSLLAAAASATAAQWLRRAALGAVAAASVFVACATKETSVVLIPIAVGWLAVERWSREPSEPWTRFARTYAAVSLVAVAAFFAVRSHYAALPLAEGTYTRAYALQSAGPAVFRIAAWLARDFAFLLPLLAAAALTFIGGTPAHRRLILYAGIWMAGWLAVYVPWPATFEYYLLPFAFGAAALAGVIAGHAWDARAAGQPVRRRAYAVLVASGLLWLVAVVNAAMDARVQLAVDLANAELVDFLGALPAGSRVVVNMSPVNEYHYELPMHLSEIKGRPDVVIERGDHAAAAVPAAPAVFVVTPEVENQPRPTVRVAVNELGAKRDQATLTTILAGRAELVYRTVHETRLVEVGIQRLLCPIAVRPVVDVTYCPGGRGLLDARTFSYGWQVHRLLERRT